MQYTLRTLEAQLLKHSVEIADENHGKTLDDGTIQWGGFPIDVFSYISELKDADGVSFLCPLCFEKNGGNVGTHGIQIYFVGGNVPANIGLNKRGVTVRWTKEGTNLDNLVCTPSILLESGCGWHGFIGSNGISPGHAG